MESISYRTLDHYRNQQSSQDYEEGALHNIVQAGADIAGEWIGMGLGMLLMDWLL